MPLIPMADKPLLELQDVDIAFSSPDEADIVAVRQVDLTLTAGKTLCLVGESGCGESVTARAVLRLLDQNASISKGRILFSPEGGETVDISRAQARQPRHPQDTRQQDFNDLPGTDELALACPYHLAIRSMR